MQVNCYKSSLTGPCCISLNIKYKPDKIFIVQQKCTPHHIRCMFVSGIFHHDNSKVKTPLPLSCYTQLITGDAVCSILPVVPDNENLLSA